MRKYLIILLAAFTLGFLAGYMMMEYHLAVQALGV